MPNARTYTLRVVFDKAQLEKLRAAGYRICIAKAVNGKYDVVWSTQNLSNDNVFQWTEEYQIWTGKPDHRDPYAPKNDLVEVAFGQTVSFDYQGFMNRASGPIMGNSFRVMNSLQHFSVRQKIGGTFQSVQMSQIVSHTGLAVFTSIPTIMVFLSQSSYLGQAIYDTLCTAIQVSFTGNLEQTVSYVADPDCLDSGIWIIGTTPSPSSGTFAATGPGAKALSLAVASGKLSAMTPHKYSAKNGFEPLGNGADAFKMAELINFYTHEFKPASEEDAVAVHHRV